MIFFHKYHLSTVWLNSEYCWLLLLLCCLSAPYKWCSRTPSCDLGQPSLWPPPPDYVNHYHFCFLISRTITNDQTCSWRNSSGTKSDIWGLWFSFRHNHPAFIWPYNFWWFVSTTANSVYSNRNLRLLNQFLFNTDSHYALYKISVITSSRFQCELWIKVICRPEI